MKLSVGFLFVICISISGYAQKAPCNHPDLKLTCSSNFTSNPQFNHSGFAVIEDLQPAVFDPSLCGALVSFEVPGGRFHAILKDDLGLEAYLDPALPYEHVQMVFAQTLAKGDHLAITLPRGPLEVTFSCSLDSISLVPQLQY